MRDIIAAQHEANLYSLSLSENYGSEGRARDLQLPGVQFGEIEMDLKYGIKASDLDEESNIRLGELGGFIAKLCQRCADMSIKVLASHMTGWNISNKLNLGEDWRDFFADIAKDGDSVKEYSLFLSRAMKDAFNGSLHKIVDSKSGLPVNDMPRKRAARSLRWECTCMIVIISILISDCKVTHFFSNCEYLE